MPIVEVSDPLDPRLADYVGLTDVALRSRMEPAEGLYMAESSKVIERALRAGHRPRSFLMTERWLPDLSELIAGAEDQFGPIPVFVGPAAVVQSIIGFDLHRGALAAMHRPSPRPLEDLVAGVSRLVVLEDIVDHTNVGAIFRSAAALGIQGVVVSPGCADPLYRRSVRVSMAAALELPYTRAAKWPGTLYEIRAAGFTIAALALADDAVELDRFVRQLPGRLAWVLGSEGHGLSDAALQAADVVVKIPMSGSIDSLNVAAASAVAFWASRA